MEITTACLQRKKFRNLLGGTQFLTLFLYNGVGQGRRMKGWGICVAVEFPLSQKSATPFAARLTKVVEGEGKGRQSYQSLMELVQ